MPKPIRLYDDLDALFVEKMKTALLTGDEINMPDWIDDMAAWIAQWISDAPKEHQQGMLQHAHERIDYHVRQKGKH
jgi:hypothetical protein